MATRKASKKAPPTPAKRAAKRVAKAPHKTARKSSSRPKKWKQLNGFFVRLKGAAEKIHDACFALKRSDPKFKDLEAATLDFLNVLEDLVEEGPGGPPGVEQNPGGGN